ncbi:MAG: lipase family protein [Caulobacterales bacterium]
MAKQKSLRQLQMEAFQDRKRFFDDYENTRKTYEGVVAKVGQKRTKAEQDFKDALKALDNELQTEVRESKERLSELVPIDPADAPPPTKRAAYSDRMSSLLAKLSFFSYIEFEHAENLEILKRVVEDGGLRLLKVYDVANVEAILVESDTFAVVAFRGTTSATDRKLDLDFFTEPMHIPDRPAVKVHRGFYSAYRKIEDQLWDDLMHLTGDKAIYLTGHSLGGAIALVASAALIADDEESKALGDRIAAVYTFGGPRVGCKDFENCVKAPHYRVVNRFDVVPLVPPNFVMGYRHSGDVRLLRNPGQKPLRRESATLVSIFNITASVFFWLIGRGKVIERAHSISLYVAKLDTIAAARRMWR